MLTVTSSTLISASNANIANTVPEMDKPILRPDFKINIGIPNLLFRLRVKIFITFFVRRRAPDRRGGGDTLIFLIQQLKDTYLHHPFATMDQGISAWILRLPTVPCAKGAAAWI